VFPVPPPSRDTAGRLKEPGSFPALFTGWGVAKLRDTGVSLTRAVKEAGSFGARRTPWQCFALGAAICLDTVTDTVTDTGAIQVQVKARKTVWKGRRARCHSLAQSLMQVGGVGGGDLWRDQRRQVCPLGIRGIVRPFASALCAPGCVCVCARARACVCVYVSPAIPFLCVCVCVCVYVYVCVCM
jgi:hypothetical protein